NVDVHETQRVLEILLPQNTAGFVFRIYRYHDQQAEAFTRLTARPTDNFKDATFYVGDGFIALYANRFSTYAIGMIPGVAVAFDANGGTGTMADQTVQGTAELNANAFTRGGYAFAGWNTNADGSGTVYTDRQSISPSSNLTLYAQWNRISYDSPSGSDDSSDSATYLHPANTPSGGTVSASPDAARNGETVTITVRPDTGYTADAVTVTGTNGRSVAVKKVNGVTYTYSQPGMDVTINAAFRATGGTETPAAFSDVSAFGWYAGAVRWALENGVMNGVGDGRFDPNGDTSRAMVATMLWRLEGSPAYAGAGGFADVKSEDWYAQAVRWADAEGIVTGYTQDGAKVFSPNGAVTREQLATMLYRYAQHKGQGFTGLWTFPLDYPDAASVSDWAHEAMCWLTMKGIINGVSGNLAPAASASRAQVATMFMRYCENR
ncbi:MAG: S-layer homology domain-containing protein, partial [Clostridia bacterium]|nr:S-layer homology domain-containing protein [Clostridia bacterium]